MSQTSSNDSRIERSVKRSVLAATPVSVSPGERSSSPTEVPGSRVL
jgi:hypothetical protein